MKRPSAVDAGNELRRKILAEASTVLESSKRVQQLALPLALGTTADQMLMPGFDLDQRLDPRRTWRPR